MRNVFQKLLITGLLLFVSNAAMGMDDEIKIEEKAEYGKYLTDSKGMTLYWYVKDSAGKSMCNSECITRWPVFYRKSVAAPAGVAAEDFGEIKRPDGKLQTTFRGFPLYYNVNDTNPGDINRQKGNNILGLIINPENFPEKK